MNNLGSIALGVGLQDGLNPCIFMTCAVFILHGFWLRPGLGRATAFRVVFGLIYLLLFAVWLHVMTDKIKRGPEEPAT